MQCNRRVNRGERERHRDDRSDQLACAFQCRLHTRQAFAHVPLNIFNNNNRVVYHKSDREHDREQRQQVQRETENLHQEQRADERDRNRHDRYDHGAERSEEQEDHEHHDEQRVDQSFHDFVNGVTDVSGRIVSDPAGHTGRQLALDLLHLRAHALDHVY